MVFPDTDYYIVATADGYEKYVSEKISVDKEIVRHDIQMTPIKKSNNDNSSNNNSGNSGNAGNTENTNKDNNTSKVTNNNLPKTGSAVDSNVFVLLGVMFMISGAFIFRKKQQNN